MEAAERTGKNFSLNSISCLDGVGGWVAKAKFPNRAVGSMNAGQRGESRSSVNRNFSVCAIFYFAFE